jgi:signal transduction histidine kinase
MSALDMKRLRLITIVGPVAFLLALELTSFFILRPVLANNAILRLLIVFTALAVATVPFAFWVFGTIERQQRDVTRSNQELEQRVDELDAANTTIALHNRQLDAVNTAIGSISSAIDLEQVLQNITDAARSLVNASYAALGVSDQNGRILQFITSGISREQREAIGPLPVGHGLLGVLIKQGIPLRIPDIARDPRSLGFPANHPPMTSLLGVPILFQGEPVGDLYLTDKIGAGEFSQDDQDVLVLLANHAAVAIENARLYEAARAARDRLKIWNEQLEGIVAERTRQIEVYSKEMTTRVLSAQEEERKRIARELHDETAQSLSTLLITLDLYEPLIPVDNGRLHEGLERARELARRALDETRAISHDLRPTILDDVGLVAALQWYADEHKKTFGVPVEVEIYNVNEEHLTPENEIALFRIAQEALNNSGKYAGAAWARIALSFTEDTATLKVEDNGRGFNPANIASPSKESGLGLYGMRERATLLDGTLTIDSAPGHGTRIVVTMPLTDAAAEPTPLGLMGAPRGEDS